MFLQVAYIDAKEEAPVGHGEVICFSIYSAKSDVQAADFGSGKNCIWVDVLDGGRGVLMEFAPFFEDSSIKKVQHFFIFIFYFPLYIIILRRIKGWFRNP